MTQELRTVPDTQGATDVTATPISPITETDGATPNPEVKLAPPRTTEHVTAAKPTAVRLEEVSAYYGSRRAVRISP